jgi:hypothetical protein
VIHEIRPAGNFGEYICKSTLIVRLLSDGHGLPPRGGSALSLGGSLGKLAEMLTDLLLVEPDSAVDIEAWDCPGRRQLPQVGPWQPKGCS